MELTALLISGLSLFVALVGVVWAIGTARSSNRSAQEAIEQARAANQLSSESNSIAEESQRVAVEAKEIGKRALDVTRRAELRDTDPSDIHWEGSWKEPGLYVLTNLGDDEAFNVRIKLSIDNTHYRATEERVPGRGSIHVECPEARTTFMNEVRDYRRRLREFQNLPFARIEPHPETEYAHVIYQRINWVTKHRKTGTHDKELRFQMLGEFR